MPGKWKACKMDSRDAEELKVPCLSPEREGREREIGRGIGRGGKFGRQIESGEEEE